MTAFATVEVMADDLVQGGKGMAGGAPAQAEEDVPDEYVCPITHVIMTDPVIIESGASFERQAIMDWFTKGYTRCPMTNQEVNTHVLISNIFLKNEIRKFLEHGPEAMQPSCVTFEKPAITPTAPTSPGTLEAALAEGHRKRLSGGSVPELGLTALSQVSLSDPSRRPPDVKPLIQTLLLSQDKKTKKNAITELFVLSSEAQHAHDMVKAGGLEALRRLLMEHSNTLNLMAASTIANIAAVNNDLRQAVGKADVIPLVVSMLCSGQSANRATACGALKCLALAPSLKGIIAQPEAVKLLVKLLKDNACRSKAAATLANLTTDHPANCKEIGTAAAIETLLKLLKVTDEGCMNYAAATLEHLADEPECRVRFTKAHAVKPLVMMLNGEDADQRAAAACVLRYLCHDNDIAAKVQELGGLVFLENMLQSPSFYSLAAALGTLRVLVHKGNVKELLPGTKTLPSLVRLLKHSSASIVEGAAAMLMDLASGVAANQDKLAAAGVFPPLVQVLANGISIVCKTYAAGAISNLCLAHAANKDRTIEAGGVLALVALCNGQESAVLAAVRCLLTICTDHVPGKLALASVGLPSLVELLHTMRTEQNVVMYAVLVLMQCASGCPEIQEQIADAGGIQALVDVLASPDVNCKFPVAGALTALSSGTPVNRKKMVAAGAVPLLVQMMQFGLRCPESTPHLALRRHAAATVAYLALEHEHKQQIAEAGALPLLRRWLASNKQKSATAAACAATWHLCLHNDFNRQVMIRCGSVPLLSKLLESSDPSVRMFAAGALLTLDSSEQHLQGAVGSGALPMLITHYGSLQELDYAAKDTVAVVFKVVSSSETLRNEILKAGGVNVLSDLLTTGDEFCKAQASETIANLAADDQAHEVLVQGRVAPLLVDLVRLGNTPCQRQALWALHSLGCARLALGDERMVSQLESCGADSTLRLAAQARDATVKQLASMILAHLNPEIRTLASGSAAPSPRRSAVSRGTSVGSEGALALV